MHRRWRAQKHLPVQKFYFSLAEINGTAHEIHKAARRFIIHIAAKNHKNYKSFFHGIHRTAGITISTGNEDDSIQRTDSPRRQRACHTGTRLFTVFSRRIYILFFLRLRNKKIIKQLGDLRKK